MNVRRLSTLCILAVLLTAALGAQAPAFTMEQILGVPFPDNLTASPDGTVLVWKVHVRGAHNLYTNAGGTIRKITNYDQDDGMDVADVHVLPSNDAVVYLIGGVEDNAGGENPNPLSILPPPARDVSLQSFSGGAPLKIGEGSQIALSPRGNAVAWVNAGVLQVSTLQKGANGYTASKPEPLAIRGQAQSPVWSPDGTRIAFTNVRDDHAYIVIYDPTAKRYVYATPDFSIDYAPAWSPDGTQVAFVRTPGNREGESPYLDPPRQPWSIWIANASSGNAHMVWQARRGMGAQFYPSEMSSAQLWWMGQKLAFLWEGDGWQHIYTVPLAGGAATRLTSGAFEVEAVSQSLDRSKLIYATNEGDIDRRHLWEVGLDERPHALTSGHNNQWSPTPLAGGEVAYIEAGYSAPPAVMLGRTSPKPLVAVAAAADDPAKDLVEPKLVTFRAPDGLTIHGQLFVPRGAGKHPAMIFVHGGPVRQMLAGYHYMEPYTNLYESNQYLADHGFVVLSINYRTGIMYGHNFRLPPHYGWFGASEYQDVVAGARWLQARSDVNGSRLGIYGLSYGGYLTAMGLARNSHIFKAGADYAGVHNWATDFDHDYGSVVGTPAQRKVAYDASPIAALDRWRSPVFLSQGDDDRNVPFSQGVDLATRLRDRNVSVQTYVFANETHANQVWRHLVDQYQAAANFLISTLRP